MKNIFIFELHIPLFAMGASFFAGKISSLLARPLVKKEVAFFRGWLQIRFRDIFSKTLNRETLFLPWFFGPAAIPFVYQPVEKLLRLLMRRQNSAQNAHLPHVNCAFSPHFSPSRGTYALPQLRSLPFSTDC
ncbi:MAG: hypothetical protein RI601_09390 [Desulfurivibrionaceae bacterium]|nr:hypothetical protein [Desulfurivibrionaceae bacterium]